jgi:hypothetical protein
MSEMSCPAMVIEGFSFKTFKCHVSRFTLIDVTISPLLDIVDGQINKIICQHKEYMQPYQCTLPEMIQIKSDHFNK